MASFRDLTVYKKSFSLAMAVFEISKAFPKEEKYSLTDQIRRSSRSVCTNIAEAYRKRIYPKHFVAKMTDADGENSETQVWLEFALACEYLDQKQFTQLFSACEEVGRLLGDMIKNPRKYSQR